MFVIKFLIYFSLSFVILSIPVSEKKVVFNYANEIAKPYTKQIFSSIRGAISNSITETKRIGDKLVNNTSIKEDKIKSTTSAGKKSSAHSVDSHPKDSYTPQEREALLRILQQTHH